MTERPEFEVGQIWRSRDGELYRVAEVNEDEQPYPVEAHCMDGGDTISVTEYGRFHADPDNLHDADLIELVSEAPGAAERSLRDEAIRNSVAEWCMERAKTQAKPPTQTPAVNLRLEALKLAVQVHGETPQGLNPNPYAIRNTAASFLAFLDPPPPAEDLPADLNDDSYELAGTEYDTDGRLV
jgi:hypothetical protein